MPREPELSIKVNVDPHVDPQQTRDTIQRKFNDIKNPPTVTIKPDLSKFDSFIKDDLGGDYSVDITPNIAGDIKGKIKEEIDKAVKSPDFPKVPLKVDVGDFSNELSSALKKELKDVNDKLSYYLKNLTTNTAGLNSVVEGLFPKKGISNAIQHELKNVQKELQTGIGDVSKSVSFKTSDLFKIDNKETTHTIQEVKKLVNELKQDLWDLDSTDNIDGDFVKRFDEFKGKAVELKSLISTLEKNLSSSDLKKIFNNGVFDTNDFAMNIESFVKVLDRISSIKDIPTLKNWDDIVDKITEGAKEDTDYIDSFCEEAIEDLTAVSKRASEVVSEQKTAIETIKELSKTLNKSMDLDKSGYLDESEIKTYGAAFDEVLSDIATKQAEINNVKQKTIALEDKLLIKTRINRDVLGKELEEYASLLKKFDDTKLKTISDRVADTHIDKPNIDEKPKETPKVKSTPPASTPNFPGAPNNKKDSQSLVNDGVAKIKKVVFDVKQEDLQNSVDTLFSKISAPIGFRPAENAIENVRTELTNALKNIDFTLTLGKQNVNGETTATATATSESQSTSDLKKQATSIGNIKRNLEVVTTGIDKYMTDIASVGTTFEYSMSQVDALNKGLENQITDFNVLDGKIEDYINKTNELHPVELSGHINVELDDIIVPKKIPLNGELEITNATKEIKEATRKAQPKQPVAKQKNGLTDRDFERKSKELLTSLASIMKGKARVQNSLTTHTRKGQSEAAAEDSYYLSNLSRRERTTKGKLTKLYKERGGRSAWQSSSIYHSATEDSEHIRNSRVAENSDKDKVAEEEKYIAALRQRSKIYKELAVARRKYGDDSEYVKSSQKELQNTLDIISQFESKVGSQYLQAMPERRKVFAENMSNFRKDRDDIRHKNTQIAARDQQKAIVATNKSAEKERIASEKEFLENLAKEPKLWADAEKARKKYGDNSAEAKQAEYLRDKNQSSINDFKSNYTGSLSDIPGYDDQVKENNFAMAAYQSGMTREANVEQQKQHDAAQAAFQKRRDEAAKQAEAAQKAVEKSSIDMVNRVAKSIEESKKIYLDAEKEIIKRQAELLTTEDPATKQDILDKISDAKNLKKTVGARINSYSGDYTGLVQNAWDEINSEKKSYKIDQSRANEKKSNKEIAATFDEIIGKYSELDKLEQRRSKLFKPEDVQQLQNVDEAIVKLTDDITKLEIKALDSGIDLHANSDYSNKVAESSKISKESAVTFTNNQRAYDVNAAKESYLTNYKDWLQNMDYIDRIDPNSVNAQELISRYQKRADENKQAIDAARQILSINNDISKDAWDEIQRWKDSLSITDAEKAAKEAQKATDKKDSDDAAFFTKLQTAVNRKIKAYDDFMKAEPGTKDWISKSGKNSIADNNLLDLQNQATSTGLSSDQRYSSIMGQYRKDINAVNEAQQKRVEIEEEAIKVQDKDIISLQKFIKTVDAYKGSIEKDNKTDMPVYANVTNIRGSANDLLSRLQKDTSGDKDQVAIDWAKDNKIDGIKSLIDAYNKLGIAANEAGIDVQELRIDVERMNKTAKGKTEVANLKSQLMDYLEKFPKVSSTMSDSVRELQAALSDPNAYQNVGKLKQQMAELRAQAKALGLESESLFDKFEKLFGQHLSTMITMAALHKMQDALRIVYQNVVEIDTAVTELRKVSEYAGKSLEEYMSRASEQAQKLGVSISDYVNSTADWKRLGYSDEDAENLATYSTLLKNVGDGIDDVNTSSSYLISTLQGFGLLADQAEDVVNKIDAVANTQPVTANDLGEILTRSSAAMAAANNTLEETLALGTAANSVIQDADSVGTMLKTLSMYLRAAKTDAENAGIEVDGMANSVSELRSELKSLTGVDIMLDSKSFKSTYQIMKELSQVWGSLSDVTQANVTEMIGGKRNSNAVSAILNNFSVAESTMESAANSANVAWAENEKYLDSIQGRLAQLDASFQALSTDVLDSDLVKTVVSLATGLTKAADAMIKFTGAIPMGAGIATFITQLGKPKMTGFTIVPSNTPGGDTEQACCAYYVKCCSAREYLVKPTNMAA